MSEVPLYLLPLLRSAEPGGSPGLQLALQNALPIGFTVTAAHTEVHGVPRS